MFKVDKNTTVEQFNDELSGRYTIPKMGSLPKIQRSTNFHIDRHAKFRITDQGFLVCDASVTRAGIFSYRDGNGDEVRELRHPNEVFKQDSLNSLKLIPLTNNHPDVMVNSRNIKDFQVGTTGENVKRNGEFVDTTIVVTDADMVRNIQQKHADGEQIELSCGYDADVVHLPGIHDTEGHFDAVQRNISYNHVSIVEKGRAGRQVKLKLDKEETMFKIKQKGLVAGSFKMDAATLEVHEDSSAVVEGLLGKLDEAVVVIDTLIADSAKEKDVFQGKLDQATADLETAKKNAEGMIKADEVDAIIEERATIADVAKKLKLDTKEKDSRQIKIDAITACAKDFSADGKNDEYINARFDMIVDSLKNDNSGLASFQVAANLAHKKDGEKKDHRQDFMNKTADLQKEGE